MNCGSCLFIGKWAESDWATCYTDDNFWNVSSVIIEVALCLTMVQIALSWKTLIPFILYNHVSWEPISRSALYLECSSSSCSCHFTYVDFPSCRVILCARKLYVHGKSTCCPIHTKWQLGALQVVHTNVDEFLALVFVLSEKGLYNW